MDSEARECLCQLVERLHHGRVRRVRVDAHTTISYEGLEGGEQNSRLLAQTRPPRVPGAGATRGIDASID